MARGIPVLLAALLLAPGLENTLKAGQPSGNRLTYLDESDPFYVGATFPKLITPQWIGEEGVEAVVILAIDDMKEPARWELFLRPILDRLKEAQGRAALSIMTLKVNVGDPQLARWLAEGVSLEVHTLTHPCPCLAQGDFAAASSTYHGCVELMNSIPGNHAVAFRMPCCDSMNSPSPRFYSELFNGTSPAGQFLTIDSSVMNLTTTNDPALPLGLTTNAEGRERFRRYLPFPAFATTIEDYPYPYIIGRRCWEFPAMVPSDWEAQHVQGTNHPATVEDWKKALDITVLKQGTMNLVFHPHGWIRNDQIVELIDYATQKYGKKIRFLSFRDAQERLDRNLLAGHPLRARQGDENGVRLLDLNGDGYLDVILANDTEAKTRLWNSSSRTWTESGFPTPLVLTNQQGAPSSAGAQFGIIRSGLISALVQNPQTRGAWTFDGKEWKRDEPLLSGLESNGKPVFTAAGDPAQGLRDRGARLRDLDNDGHCELIVANEQQRAVLAWSGEANGWKPLRYGLPEHVELVDPLGHDNGVRFVDVNQDGFADLLFSNEQWFSLHLFVNEPYLGFGQGWSRMVVSGRRGEPGAIPMITRSGANNGAWFHGRGLWLQNEDTSTNSDKVERVSFDRLLAGAQPPALSPQESLKAIRVRPGFKVELVAQEPLVEDPIAFDWGADGRLWVVEMGDYPLGVPGSGEGGGRIRFLEDTNQDGIYDRSTIFLEGLSFPTGVMPWGKGVLVSAAPEIFYAEDTNGDGKADVRRSLFQGFGEGNQQHRLNGFEYGLDNWLYGANGDSGGAIHGANAGPAVDIRGRDFRFRPATLAFEAVTGGTQFGRHRDDWGNWFGNNNSSWLWHYFLPEHYLARNPSLAVKSTRRILANYSNSGHLYPISRPLQRFNDIGMVGEVTSACSVAPYRDELFGPDFATSVFICEPVNNLIHREILEADGVSFRSHRAADEPESEFLASADNWFRPTMVRTGPDGALYVADMYRLIIEHPQWIPEDVKGHLDLRAGHDKGRIYRVYPAGAALRSIPKLDRLDTITLVAALDSPNGWERDTVQRLLVERGDKKAIGPLAALVTGSKHPKTRLQALCTLDGLGTISLSALKHGLSDPHPGVREQAVRISEALLDHVAASHGQAEHKSAASIGDKRRVGEALLKCVQDPAIRVRYQLAFSLGQWDDPRAAEGLVKLGVNDPADEALQLAVMSSAPAHLSNMLAVALAARDARGSSLIARLFGLTVAVHDEPTLSRTLGVIGKAAADGSYGDWQFEALGSVLEALDARDETLSGFRNSTGKELGQAVSELEGLFRQSRARADADEKRSDSECLAVLHVLGHRSSAQPADLDRLGRFLQPRYSVAVQEAALRGLGVMRQARAGEILISSWSACSPALRPLLLSVLMARREWTYELLRAIEAERIPARQIGAAEQQRLRTDRDGAIRTYAAKLFETASSDRQKVVDGFRTVLELKGDGIRGAALFQQNCAICHKFQALGPIGPDLGTVADKPIDALLIAILDPNRAVEARYVNYTAVLKDGRELGGLITGETSTSITLRSTSGDSTLLRSDLESFVSSGLSLMPEGFETVLSPQDVADVIAFIRKR